MTFGKKLRTLRTARGLSQIELSKLAQVDSRFISLIETDKILPNPAWERRLRKALNWDEITERGLEILAAQAEHEPAA